MLVGCCAGSKSCIDLMHQKPGRESESGCVIEVREVRDVRDVTEVRVVSVSAEGGLELVGWCAGSESCIELRCIRNQIVRASVGV